MGELKNDPTAMLNTRNLIEQLLTADSRVKCNGAGVWVAADHRPEADLDITIDGYPFKIIVRAKPLPVSET